VAVPIRSWPPPFVCKGLVDIRNLYNKGDLTGFIRCDLPLFYRRETISNRVIHRFIDPRDVEVIDSALRSALGL
jgi:hypothetical protein